MGGLSGFPGAVRYIPIIIYRPDISCRRRNIITSGTGRIGGLTGTGVLGETGGYISGNVSVNTGCRQCIATKAVSIVTIGVLAIVNSQRKRNENQAAKMDAPVLLWA
jgi:hypothetical protein